MGGWVDYGWVEENEADEWMCYGWVEENEAVRTRYCEGGVGGWLTYIQGIQVSLEQASSLSSSCCRGARSSSCINHPLFLLLLLSSTSLLWEREGCGGVSSSRCDSYV